MSSGHGAKPGRFWELDVRTFVTAGGTIVAFGVLIVAAMLLSDWYPTRAARAWVGHSEGELIRAFGEPTEKRTGGGETVFVYRDQRLVETDIGSRVRTRVRWFAIDGPGVIRDAGTGQVPTNSRDEPTDRKR